MQCRIILGFWADGGVAWGLVLLTISNQVKGMSYAQKETFVSEPESAFLIGPHAPGGSLWPISVTKASGAFET